MPKSNKPTIITNGIPNAQKVTVKFQSAYRDMLSQLAAPGFPEVLRVHEAAHVVYFAMAGMKNYDTHPAQLKYDPAIDDYVGSLASIQLLDLPIYKPGDFWPWLGRVACGHAAGGVAARKLRPLSDAGDQDDRAAFQKVCDGFNADPKISIDAEKVWKWAQDSVSQGLENPKLWSLIQDVAAELRPKFGL